ncbi:MAG: hypothetical protein LN590_06585 [Rickettsia endosymbiont of Glossina mortisans submortisans]|nr:hypothetical protein [Rickettsia endosymbiont of Glossina mortisans submortisans]
MGSGRNGGPIQIVFNIVCPWVRTRQSNKIHQNISKNCDLQVQDKFTWTDFGRADGQIELTIGIIKGKSVLNSFGCYVCRQELNIPCTKVPLHGIMTPSEVL